ncbi:TIGR02680 family protein [Candidatus Poriferisodalis sp.]|uniref:TIGR02680 family protein n=1 Tax=Candidatus Poriferisodalis sp. TaxID=3101277 RepID=UPI003D1057F1
MGTAVDDPPTRWRLERAGIMNVYQYGDEVLDFAGGRLLLRGVNGSGKSTAMNMLLPFLLTARQRNIDAARDQSGLLASWMLGGRDDSQPVGYLWIEFRCGDAFFVCGCGIKANRAANNVVTWWFATSKRPGIDIDLVVDGVPLSAEVLRDKLDGDPVFAERDRREYRRLIEQRLFGGASLDQHIRLLDKVRNPRVGDRIDVDLPLDLADALPQLSEQALTDAAAPLDDLEDHRRNVAELERTVSAVGGLLDRYRSYCASDLRQRAAQGRRQLDEAQRFRRDEAAARKAVDAAEVEVVRFEAQIADEQRGTERLRSQISAIEESSAYQEGRQLDGVRDLVTNLSRQHGEAQRSLEGAEERVRRAVEDLIGAVGRSEGDLNKLNGGLAQAEKIAARCGLAERPPTALVFERHRLEDLDIAVPESFDATPAKRRLDASAAAAQQRRRDIKQVAEARTRCDQAEGQFTRATDALQVAANAKQRAVDQHAQRRTALAAAQRDWATQVGVWASTAVKFCASVGSPSDVAAKASRNAELPGGDQIPSIAALRVGLLAEFDAAVGAQTGTVAQTRRALDDSRDAVRDQQAVLDKLLSRAEPEPPRLDWQVVADHCFADLVDFAPELDAPERASVEAALEAAGLLAARVAADDVLELASGELVVVAASPVARPLRRLLRPAVPAALAGSIDESVVARLLDSISCDVNAEGFTVAASDGSFRSGLLRGRHSKERAELIGAAARRDALERERAAARLELETLQAEVQRLVDLSDRQQESLDDLHRHRAALPDTSGIEHAAGAADTAASELAAAEARHGDAAHDAAQAERAVNDADTALRRTATTLSLPRDRSELDSVAAEVAEFDRLVSSCVAGLTTLQRSVQECERYATQSRNDITQRDEASARLAQTESERAREQARLDMLERTVGADYERIRQERDRLAADLEMLERRLPETRRRKEHAVERRASARAASSSAQRAASGSEESCETCRVEFEEVLRVPGYFDALASDETASPPAAQSGGSAGLAASLDDLGRLNAAADGERGADSAVNADSVRQSLQQRRDSLGAGWDAVALQPDPARPLYVEVTGPSGIATLPAALRVASAQHRQLAGLLDRKQQDALRELLQGLIAKEIAEKMHGAGHLIELTNERLRSVATAHRVGVRLRWRRSPELDASTKHMVKLLAKPPDLRTPDEIAEVRDALSQRLDAARADQPDASYRQLIAETLDYKTWHDLDVMVTRPEAPEGRLSRRTPLSEGEKKLVTYLPLFVAVAASYDALAEAGAQPGTREMGIARFVLLDDAFAKVSADNHAALFGLLVSLDLDFIATSERLWGDHRTVPELSIVEIVRDAGLKSILLDRYSWQGDTLERVVTS